MKGKIDIGGLLYIERAGKQKEQYCPEQREDMGCGDWCPKFREPERRSCGGAFLSICGGDRFHKFNEFTDERTKEGI